MAISIDILSRLDEYEITELKGKMVSAEIVEDDSKTATMTDAELLKYRDSIKKGLCSLIANKLYEDGMVDFLKMNNIAKLTTSYRGYIYLTPALETQIVRRLNKRLTENDKRN